MLKYKHIEMIGGGVIQTPGVVTNVGPDGTVTETPVMVTNSGGSQVGGYGAYGTGGGGATAQKGSDGGVNSAGGGYYYDGSDSGGGGGGSSRWWCTCPAPWNQNPWCPSFRTRN